MGISDSQRLLVIGKVWPEPASSAAGYRLMQIIDILQKDGFEITFASAAAVSDFSLDLEPLGIRSEPIALNSSSFDEFITDLNPDVVIFDRFMTEEQFGWRVAEQCPDTIRVLDTEDLHFLRESRRLALKKGKEWSSEYFLNDTTMRELASMYRCDLNIIISEFEMKLLTQQLQFPEELLLYIPFLVDSSSMVQIPKSPVFEDRQHFVTIGNFLHEPNWDSVLFLKQDIWPQIREKLPEAELHVYGAYPSQKVLQLHNQKEGFIIKGRAEDALETISQYRILLAPLRFGAGLKGKLLDAMLTGTPSITTDIGAEGMGENDDWPGAIINATKELADLSVTLYKDDKIWREAQEKAQKLIESKFNRQEFERHLTSLLSDIKKNLTSYRQTNIIGRILEHQSLRATKYMSKWIEEKNRK